LGAQQLKIFSEYDDKSGQAIVPVSLYRNEQARLLFPNICRVAKCEIFKTKKPQKNLN